jgi:hypothetical protein
LSANIVTTAHKIVTPLAGDSDIPYAPDMLQIWGEYAVHFKSDLAMAACVVNPSHHDANQQANESVMNTLERACDYFAAVDGVLEQVRGIVLAGIRLEKLGCNSGSPVVAVA